MEGGWMNATEGKKHCIFVGGIPGNTSPQTVSEYFGQFGRVGRVKLNKTRSGQGESASHRGCGFIEMETREGMLRVLSHSDHYIGGQRLDCRVAMTNRERKAYHNALNLDRRKVFIGKLPKTVTKETIEAFFSRIVAIEETTLIQKETKDFAICFLLLQDRYAGELLAGHTFEILPGVHVECQLALFPQQLHQRKLQQTMETDNACQQSTLPSDNSTDVDYYSGPPVECMERMEEVQFSSGIKYPANRQGADAQRLSPPVSYGHRSKYMAHSVIQPRSIQDFQRSKDYPHPDQYACMQNTHADTGGPLYTEERMPIFNISSIYREFKQSRLYRLQGLGISAQYCPFRC